MSKAGCVRVELVTERSALPLSRDQWNALVANNETNTVFQTFEWFDAWWSVFGVGRQLFFLIIRCDDHIIGFAPLMLCARFPGVKQLEFVGTGNADYQDVVLPTRKEEGVAAICAFLRANTGAWMRGWLVNIPAQSSTLDLLSRAGREMGLFLVEETRAPCPALRLEGAESAAARMLQKYSMRRPLSWFSRQGAVTFRHLDSAAEIAAKLPVFFDQHVRRWGAVGKGSLFQDAKQRAFYSALALRMGETKWLQFSIVELDGEPIAFHYGFDYAGSILWYKPSFHERYAEHSPGLLLIQQLIEDALRRGRREVDFTIGDEAFKKRFANHQRSNVYSGLYHSRTAYRAALVVKQSRRWVGRYLRRLRGDSAARSADAASEEST